MRPGERKLPLEALPGFACVGGLVQAVTTRAGGVSREAHASLDLDLDLGRGRGAGDDAGRVARNRQDVARALGFEALTLPHQVHGVRVRRIERPGEDPGACTFDDARFFSHRRDRGVTGRHALLAGWAPCG